MRSRIVITLLVLLGLPALVVATGWYLLGNEAFVKQQLQNLVLRQTGRSLEVAGPLSLTLGIAPGSSTRIEAQDIRLSNANWAAEPYITQIGRFGMSVDFWSFFSENPVIDSLEAENCQLALAEDSSGARNWDLWPGASMPDDAAQDASLQRRHFQLIRLQLNDCKITHAAPDRPEPLVISLSELSLERNEAGNYSGRASGELADMPLSVTGQFGPVRSIWQGGPFDSDLDLSVGKISLHSTGSFTDVRTGSGANVSIKFSGPEFAEVTQYLALPPFSSDAFDFSLELKTHGAMTSVDVDGDLGSFEISASGELDRILKPTAGNLNMTTKGPDLQTLGQLFGLEGLANTPFELTLATTVENGRAKLAPAVLTTAQDRVEVSGLLGLATDLKDSELTIAAHSDEIGRWASLLGHPVSVLGPLSANGQLKADSSGELSVQGEIQYRESRLKLNGTLGQLPQPKLPSLDFDLSTPDASKLAAISQIKGLPVAAFTAKGHLARENGGIQFTSVGGSLAKNQFEFSGFLGSGSELTGSKFKLQAKIPSTSALGLLFGYKDLPDESLDMNATITPVGQGVDFTLGEARLGEMQLALQGHIADVHKPELFTADGKIDLPSLKLLQFVAPELKLPDLPLSFSGGIEHAIGIMRFRQAHFVLGESMVDLDGQLGVGLSPGSSSLKMSGSGPDLSRLWDAAFLDSLPKAFTFSGQWSSAGQNSGVAKDTIVDNFQLQLGDMKLALHGTVDNFLKPKTLALQLKLTAPDASVLNGLTELGLEAVPLSVATRYSGSLQTFSLDQLVVELGASQAKGDLQLELGDNGRISGALQSGFLDLKPWRDQVKKNQPKPEAQTAPSARDEPDDTRMFPDELVMEVGKTALDVDLDIQVDKIDLGNAEIRDAHLGILLTDHQLRLNPFELSDAQGSRVSGQFELDATVAVPTMNLKLNGANIRIGIAAAPNQDLSTYPPAEVYASLQGSGKTWHQLASSVSGKVRFFQGSGLVETAAFDTFYSDFLTRLFSGLIPANKNSAYTKYDCGVFAADVVAGQVKVDPLIIRTEHVTVLSVGTINLETEKIDFNFQTKPRTGLGINAGTVINQFIKVGGTLKHPVTEFNPAGAVIGGGAAAATLGLSYVAKSFFDRFLSSRDPCGEARKKLEKADGQVK